MYLQAGAGGYQAQAAQQPAYGYDQSAYGQAGQQQQPAAQGYGQAAQGRIVFFSPPSP